MHRRCAFTRHFKWAVPDVRYATCFLNIMFLVFLTSSFKSCTGCLVVAWETFVQLRTDNAGARRFPIPVPQFEILLVYFQTLRDHSPRLT